MLDIREYLMYSDIDMLADILIYTEYLQWHAFVQRSLKSL